MHDGEAGDPRKSPIALVALPHHPTMAAEVEAVRASPCERHARSLREMSSRCARLHVNAPRVLEIVLTSMCRRM